MSLNTKKPSFLMNVLTIIFAQIAVKLLGFAYRMVITNVPGFGDIGNGYYNFGYQIYTLLLAVSSIGIPNAISKLVAERCALDDYRGAIKVFKTALVLFTFVGLFFSGVMFFFADFIADVVFDTPPTAYTIRALSPAIIFVSVSSVIRGFFAGQQNMHATNTSQVLEQFLKSVSTILIVLAMAGAKPEYMAAGATLSTTLSTFLSCAYLFCFLGAHKKSISENIKAAPPVKIKANALSTAKTILMVSIPISLGSIVASLNRVIDIVTVVRGVKTALSASFPNAAKLGEEAVRLSGILSKTDILVNLPLALNTAFATVLVPTVAAALALHDNETARSKVSFSMLISVVIAAPCTAGYIALAQPILSMIYPAASDGGLIFAMVAPTVFFSALSQTMYGSLQGMGKIFTPALSVLCGGIAKLILNLVLIPIPSINIYGAPIGSVVCQAVAFFVSFTVLRKNLKVKLDPVRYFIKPFIASAVMGVCAFGTEKLLRVFMGRAATLGAIAVGAVVYFAMIALLRVFRREELSAIPFIGKRFKKV